MSLVKKEHWLTEDFPEFLVQRRNVPFAWGSNDCATFAADAIKAITGTDIADDFRGKYTTERGAFKSVKAVAGGSTVVDAAAYCAEKHGLIEHQYPLMAKRGDLVIVRNGDGGEIAGIVSLNGRHVLSPGDSGLALFSIIDITRAWSLGDAHEWTPPKKDQELVNV
jgi:cell wall-associated NlpC family hydrolase